MNWDSQVLVHLYKIINKTKGVKNNKNNNKKIKDAILAMVARYNVILNTFDNIDKNDELEKLETNQLAVLFEGLFNLVNVIDSLNSDRWCFKLFLILMKRWNINSELLLFLDKTARIDITVHFLDGLTNNY